MSVGRWLQDDNKESIQPNRNRIYQHIVDNPGCHLRKIRKDLKLAVGDTQYHLQILEKRSLIKSRRMGIFRVYYAASVLEQRQESILAVLRQEVPRDIILFLLEHPGSTQGEIARHKGFTAPTINWHMSRLIEIGLIRSKKEGKFVNYYVEGNVRDITIMLRTYYPSTWSKLSNRLAELFLDMSEASRPDSTNENQQNKLNFKKNNNSRRKTGRSKQSDQDFRQVYSPRLRFKGWE